MSEIPEYKEIYSVVLEDLEEVAEGKLCPKYQFGDEEPEFVPEEALAVLLMDRVIITNAHHWIEDWPKEAKEVTGLFVNSSDVFVWGATDAEELPFKDLEKLYDLYHMDRSWGPTVWCIQQRGYMPQKPIYDAIQKHGVWDLDTMNLGLSFDDRIKED